MLCRLLFVDCVLWGRGGAGVGMRGGVAVHYDKMKGATPQIQKIADLYLQKGFVKNVSE